MSYRTAKIAITGVAIAFLLAIQDFGLHLASTGVTTPARQAENTVPRNAAEAVAVARIQALRSRSAAPFWKMAERFPDEPALYAGFLRYSGLYGHALRSGPGGPKAYQTEVRRREQAIAAGKRLEPYNACFDYREAGRMFDRGQVSAALEALHRAAGKSRFDDHGHDQILAVVSHYERGVPRWAARLHPGAKLTMFSAEPSPQYLAYRGTAKCAAEQIERAIRAGDLDTGLRVTNDLVAVGGLMRDSSYDAVGVLVGVAIQKIGISAIYRGSTGKTLPSDMSNVERLSALRAVIPDKLGASQWQELEDNLSRSDEFLRRTKWYINRLPWLTTYTTALTLLVSSWMLLIAGTGVGVMGYGASVWLGRRGQKGLDCLGPNRLSVRMLATLPTAALLVITALGSTARAADPMRLDLVMALLLFLPVVAVPVIAAARVRIAPEIGRWDAFLSRLRTAASHAVPGLVALYFLASAVWIPFALRASDDLDKVIKNEAKLVWECPLPPK